MADNSTLRSFGAARHLDRLKGIGPFTITPRVKQEQERHGPPPYSAALKIALKDGWVILATPPDDLDTQQLVAWSKNLLSTTDAELLSWAKRATCPLFTNDGPLIRAAASLKVEAVDVTQTLAILRENGHIDQVLLKKIVSDIEWHDHLQFTPAQREALDLD